MVDREIYHIDNCQFLINPTILSIVTVKQLSKTGWLIEQMSPLAFYQSNGQTIHN